MSPRLVSIYKRTLHLKLSTDVSSIQGLTLLRAFCRPTPLIFKVPLPSCQYIFNSFREFARPSLKLLSDNTINAELRNKYLQIASEKSCRTFIVGVSWRGGGRPDRIKQKSLEPSDFCRILSGFPNVQFVSLQYGDVSLQCEEWSKSGTHIFVIAP